MYTATDLWNYYEELVGAKDTTKPVVLQEVSYNDGTEMQGITAGLQHFPLNVAYIDQWPVSSRVANADASPPTNYGAYGGSTTTTGTLVVTPCTLTSGQTTCTTTASWSTSNAANVGLYVNGSLVQNSSNITTTLTGSANVTLGLTASVFSLIASQGVLATEAPSAATESEATTVQSALSTQSVAAIDPLAPAITLAGLGGSTNRAIWAIGSNISNSCSVQLYAPGEEAASSLASLASANCQANSLSFPIPTAILTNYNSIDLVVTNPGSHISIPINVPLQIVPTLAVAGLGGTNNQAIWAIGTNFSSGCTVQLYDPKAQSSPALVSITNVSCQADSLSFVIPSSIRSNYSSVTMAVTNADGQSSPGISLSLPQ